MHAREVMDLVPEYTHPITAESDERIDELSKLNEEDRKNGKEPEYDAFGYYLSIIFDYARTFPDTQEIIKYFKWVIIHSNLDEAHWAYSNEPLSHKEANRYENLRKVMRAQIESLEMGFPFGRSVEKRQDPLPLNNEHSLEGSNLTKDFWSYEKIGRNIVHFKGDYKTVIHHTRNITDRYSGLLIPSQLYKRNMFRINKDELKIVWKNENMPGEMPLLD